MRGDHAERVIHSSRIYLYRLLIYNQSTKQRAEPLFSLTFLVLGNFILFPEKHGRPVWEPRNFRRAPHSHSSRRPSLSVLLQSPSPRTSLGASTPPDTSPVPNDGVHLCRCPHRSACAGRAPPRLPLNPRAHPRRCRRAGQPRGDPRHGRLRSGSASVKGTVRKQNEDRFASYVSYPPHRRDVGRPMPETLAPSSPPREPSDDVWWTVVL